MRPKLLVKKTYSSYYKQGRRQGGTSRGYAPPMILISLRKIAMPDACPGVLASFAPLNQITTLILPPLRSSPGSVSEQAWHGVP
jgi:hypothetical protein